MIVQETYVRLRASHVILRSALWFHWLFLLLWALLSIIPGFCRYDAVPPLGFNAIGHIFFWLPIEMFVVVIGYMSASFDIGTFERGLVLDLRRTVELMTFWTVLLVIAMAANILHLVACIMEYSQGLSTLMQTNSAFLIAFMVLLGFVLLVEAMEIYIVVVYKNRMRRVERLFLQKKIL